MFDYSMGLGQGGGRLAHSFGKAFDIPTVYMNLAGIDFARIDARAEDVLVFEEGGTGRNPVFGEKMVSENIHEVERFLDRRSFNSSRYVLVCVGGGGGAGTGFLFPILDFLIRSKREVFLVYTLPESREGIPTKPNALKSLDRLIARYIQKNRISVLLIDNDYCVRMYGSGGYDYWGGVNNGVVSALKRFWLLTEIDRFSSIIDVASGYKALDKNDVRRIVFSRKGFMDLRQMVFSGFDLDGISRKVRESSLIFGSLDARTAQRYVVSVGLPESWKKHPGTLAFVEEVFQAISKATRHTPDVIRCSYFNKQLADMRVHLMLSGLSRGKGIDKMIRGVEKDAARLESKKVVDRLEIEKISGKDLR